MIENTRSSPAKPAVAIAPIATLLVPIFFVQMGISVDLKSFLDPSVWALAAAVTFEGDQIGVGAQGTPELGARLRRVLCDVQVGQEPAAHHRRKGDHDRDGDRQRGGQGDQPRQQRGGERTQRGEGDFVAVEGRDRFAQHRQIVDRDANPAWRQPG